MFCKTCLKKKREEKQSKRKKQPKREPSQYEKKRRGPWDKRRPRAAKNFGTRGENWKGGQSNVSNGGNLVGWQRLGKEKKRRGSF